MRLAWFALLLGACANLDSPWVCAADSDCASSMAGGTCEGTKYCSFTVDATVCASTRRYGSLASSPYANTCVPLVDHVSPIDDAPGTSDIVLANGDTIDTTTFSTSSGLTLDHALEDVAEPNATPPLVAILRVGSLVIAKGSTVSVTGSAPLVIIAATTIEIDGVLDAAAHGATSGPGVGTLGAGMNPGKTESASGAGHQTAGGDGFSGTVADMPAGGHIYDDANITVLEGGSIGGGESDQSVGGGGGGAVQLSAGTSITISGAVGAGGGGGLSMTTAHVGGGGGSGGSIYIEAPTVTVTGTLAANGGAGASGDNPGQDGPLSTAQASAPMVTGAQCTPLPAPAGYGGSVLGVAGAGGNDKLCLTSGGGAVGYVVLRASTLSTTGSTISPAANSSLGY